MCWLHYGSRFPRDAPVPSRDPPGAIGRQSVVYYAMHLVVMIAVADVAGRLGVADPATMFALVSLVPLALAAFVVRWRHLPAVDALFVYPRGERARSSAEDRGVGREIAVS